MARMLPPPFAHIPSDDVIDMATFDLITIRYREAKKANVTVGVVAKYMEQTGVDPELELWISATAQMMLMTAQKMKEGVERGMELLMEEALRMRQMGAHTLEEWQDRSATGPDTV